MKIHICDICNVNPPNADIKYKYRAKRHRWCWGDGVEWDV